MSRGLRIGIDGTCLALVRGYGRFLRELLPPLLTLDSTAEYVLFLDDRTGVDLTGLRLQVVRPPTSASQATSAGDRSRRRLGDVLQMRRAILARELDVMFFPTVFSYVPLPRRLPQAVGLYDTIAERYGHLVFSRAIDRWLWNLKVRAALARASGVITLSNWSKAGLMDVFGLAAESIHVALGAPSTAFGPVADRREIEATLRRLGLPPDQRYFVYVGGVNPHKNLRRVLDAFCRLRGRLEGGPPRLVLVGDDRLDSFHSVRETLLGRLENDGTENAVHTVGYVTDQDLRHLYAGAIAVLLVSLEEGLGLPALEGAACGTPCLATRRSPLPDLLAGGGLFVDPESEPEIESAMERLFVDPEERNALGHGALQAVSRLSWMAAAEATRVALHTIAGKAR